MSAPGPAAVVFDLDGVLIDSEQAWDAARRQVAAAHDRPWPARATEAMQGMSAPEWSSYMAEEVGVALHPAAIDAEVVDRLLAAYRSHLPVIDGAVAAVRAAAERWPLGLASSSNREVIERVLALIGLGDRFAAVVSSEEVARGKPAPDVYLEAARRLGVAPARCVAVEDSSNGLRSAAAAGLAVIAVPNRAFPPAADALALAAAVVARTADVTPALIESVAGGTRVARA